MARKLELIVATPSAPKVVDLDNIPDEIKQEVEETYKALAGGTTKMRASFDDKKELLQYEALVKAYCAHRPEGALRYRRSPTRGLPENVMDYRITDVPVEAEAATEAVTAAVQAVKDAVATAPAAAATPAKRTARK